MVFIFGLEVILLGLILYFMIWCFICIIYMLMLFMKYFDKGKDEMELIWK